MILQALEYETVHNVDLGEFFESTAGKFKTGTGMAWAHEVFERRQHKQVPPIAMKVVNCVVFLSKFGFDPCSLLHASYRNAFQRLPFSACRAQRIHLDNAAYGPVPVQQPSSLPMAGT